MKLKNIYIKILWVNEECLVYNCSWCDNTYKLKLSQSTGLPHTVADSTTDLGWHCHSYCMIGVIDLMRTQVFTVISSKWLNKRKTTPQNNWCMCEKYLECEVSATGWNSEHLKLLFLCQHTASACICAVSFQNHRSPRIQDSGRPTLETQP